MKTDTGAAKPAAAKRMLFKRPKWAANNVKPESGPVPQQANDFFSRSNETFASFAAQEEEREQRRLARRAAADLRLQTPVPGEKPSPKRRRISNEQEASEDDEEHLSDIEADGAEELAAAATTKALVEKKEFSDLLDKGMALVEEGRSQLGLEIDERPISPSMLPYKTPQITDRDQCDQDRAQLPGPAERSSPSRQLRPLDTTTSKLARQAAKSPGRSSRRGAGSNQATAIALDDDEKASPGSPRSPMRITSPLAPIPVPVSQASITIEDGPEDEFAAIERRAREQARRKRLMEETVPSPSPGPDGVSSTPGIAMHAEDSKAGSQAPEPEANIQLLITSEIPNLKPLLITRRIGQRLKEVREYWCNFNSLPDSIRSKVTLTWKKRRLYDSQSCASLGFSTSSDGRAVLKSGDHDIFDDFDGKLHLVAVAEGLSAPATSAVDSLAHTGEINPDLETASRPAPEEDIRVIIRAKGYLDCKIIVKPSTAISRMIDAFKKHGRVPSHKSVALMFDGELLQPNATVGQTEISDLEHIDAYVR